VSANVLDTFAGDSLFLFLPFLLLARGAEPALLGSFAAAFFVGNIFGKVFLGRLVDRIGTAKVFIGAELLMGFLILILAGSSAIYLIIICSILLGIFTKGTVPVLKSMIAESVEHHGNYEKAFGLAELVTGAFKTAAPAVLGAVAAALGITWAFYVMAAAVFLAIIPSLLFFAHRPRGEHAVHNRT
jgi:MFS family permease